MKFFVLPLHFICLKFDLRNIVQEEIPDSEIDFYVELSHCSLHHTFSWLLAHQACPIDIENGKRPAQSFLDFCVLPQVKQLVR